MRKGWWLCVVLAFAIWAPLAAFDVGGQRCLFAISEGCGRCDYWAPRLTAEIGYSAESDAAPVERRDRCYPAVSMMPLKLFPLTNAGAWAWTIMGAAFYLLALCYARRSLAPICFAFSAPVIFNLDLGNTIWIAAGAVAVFLADYRSPDRRRRIAAAVALGVATAFKISPAILGVVYLPEIWNEMRRKDTSALAAALTAAGVAIVLLIVPFAFMPDGFAGIGDMLANAAENGRFYAQRAAFGLGVLYRTFLIATGQSWQAHGEALTALQHATQVFGLVAILIGLVRRNLVLVVGGYIFSVPNMMYYAVLYLLPLLPLEVPEGTEPLRRRVVSLMACLLTFILICPLQVALRSGSGSYLSANILLDNFALVCLLLLAPMRSLV